MNGIAVVVSSPGESRPRAFAGVAAVAFLLAFTRWGSYIGHNPVYIADVLLVCAFVGLITRPRPTVNLLKRVSEPNGQMIALGLFVAYVVLRTIVSLLDSAVMLAARDAVPYLYACVAYLGWRDARASSEASAARTGRVLVAALVVHLLWITPVVFLGGAIPTFHVPLAGVAVLSPRADIDAAVLAVTAGYFLWRIVGLRHLHVGLVLGLAVAIADILNLQTRAGLISLCLVLMAVFGLSFAVTPMRSKRRVALVLTVPVVIGLAVAIVPRTAPGARLLASVGIQQATSGEQVNALGTKRAREQVWAGVIDWVNESSPRQVFGGGFGNDFLAQSGTLHLLEGTEYTGVRSPHSCWVGLYARVGFIGLSLAVLAVILALIGIVRNRRLIGRRPDLLICAAIIVAIIPVASFGVVLEAPFGAVPLFWAIGVLGGARPSWPSAEEIKEDPQMAIPEGTR